MNYTDLNYRYRPVLFFLLTYVITFAVLFVGIWLSYSDTYSNYKYFFIIGAVVVPTAVALFMIFGSKNAALKQDFIRRLTDFGLIRPKYWLAILLIMPCTLLLATAISLLFGQPLKQFELSPGFTMAAGQTIVNLIVVVLAPTFEETGWRGYGFDSLHKPGRSVFVQTLIYAVLWDVWHWPLFWVRGYYHSDLWQIGFIYGLNFIVSVFPVAFLMAWIFYRNSRSIPAIIIFHAMLNLFSSLFQTEQFTKCIITLILLAFTVIVIIKEKGLFFSKN